MWIQCLGTSELQEYKALVDTGAQCTLMLSSYKGAEPTCISGVTVLEAEASLIGMEWQKVPSGTSTEAPCVLGIDCEERLLPGLKRILVCFWFW